MYSFDLSECKHHDISSQDVALKLSQSCTMPDPYFCNNAVNMTTVARIFHVVSDHMELDDLIPSQAVHVYLLVELPRH